MESWNPTESGQSAMSTRKSMDDSSTRKRLGFRDMDRAPKFLGPDITYSSAMVAAYELTLEHR
jgi:hypothetical protein